MNKIKCFLGIHNYNIRISEKSTDSGTHTLVIEKWKCSCCDKIEESSYFGAW